MNRVVGPEWNVVEDLLGLDLDEYGRREEEARGSKFPNSKQRVASKVTGATHDPFRTPCMIRHLGRSPMT